MNFVFLIGNVTGMERMVYSKGRPTIAIGLATSENPPLYFRVIIDTTEEINKALAVVKPGTTAFVIGTLERSDMPIKGKHAFDGKLPQGGGGALVVHATQIMYGQTFIDAVQAQAMVDKFREEQKEANEKKINIDVLKAI